MMRVRAIERQAGRSWCGTVAARGLLIAVLLVVGSGGYSHDDPYGGMAPVEAGELPPPDPLTQRLLFIGDAGETDPSDATLATLTAWAGMLPDRTVVIFLGDNAYPAGLDGPGRAGAEARLARQVAAVEASAARAVFVPGNHDWADGGPRGLEAVRAQSAFLRGPALMLPDAGCPGPAILDLPADRPLVRLVLLNTQWWLHDWERGGDDCAAASPSAVTDALGRAIRTDVPVVVAAHHPPATHGPHGGFFDWRAQLFPLTALARWLWVPLPGLGSLYQFGRYYLGQSDQDLSSPEYRAMQRSFAATFETRSGPGPLLYAAGHEHSLQVLKGESVDYVLVSGAGSSSRLTAVGNGPDTLFAHEHSGFIAVDVTATALQVRVVQPDATPRGRVVYLLELPLPPAGPRPEGPAAALTVPLPDIH
jgi:hypothetical protein